MIVGFGKAATIGFVLLTGAAKEWAVSVNAWRFASEDVTSAGTKGTADRATAGGGQADGGVNFAASVALGPREFVKAGVLGRGGLPGFLPLCKKRRLPLSSLQGPEVPGDSVVLLETSLVA